MPAIVANAPNFLISTDYPLDKIIYISSGSFTAGAGVGTNYVVAHSLSFTPLITGSWSTTSNFTISREAGNFASYEGVDPQALNTTFTSDGTNVTISTWNPTGSSVIIYYRMYGFMPSNVNSDAVFTVSLADNFQLNTDYNYTKLITTLTGISTSATIAHNLGYRPQVTTWLQTGSSISQIYLDGLVKVDNTNLTIISPTNSVHYRVYADGQL